jgi:hypothetical protein
VIKNLVRVGVVWVYFGCAHKSLCTLYSKVPNTKFKESYLHDNNSTVRICPRVVSTGMERFLSKEIIASITALSEEQDLLDS